MFTGRPYRFDFGRVSFCEDFFKDRKMVVGAGQVCFGTFW